MKTPYRAAKRSNHCVAIKAIGGVYWGVPLLSGYKIVPSLSLEHQMNIIENFLQLDKSSSKIRTSKLVHSLQIQRTKIRHKSLRTCTCSYDLKMSSFIYKLSEIQIRNFQIASKFAKMRTVEVEL